MGKEVVIRAHEVVAGDVILIGGAYREVASADTVDGKRRIETLDRDVYRFGPSKKLTKMPDAQSGRWLITARVWVEHERGPEPGEAEVSQAVADRLGDGAYSINVSREPTAEEAAEFAEEGREVKEVIGGARVIPTATEAELARRID